jgi:hypothetical protein
MRTESEFAETSEKFRDSERAQNLLGNAAILLHQWPAVIHATAWIRQTDPDSDSLRDADSERHGEGGSKEGRSKRVPKIHLSGSGLREDELYRHRSE